MSVDPMLNMTPLDAAQTRLAGTIKQASDTTGASFAYMLASAKIESNLDAKASAPTSSAKGLYQFIEQTWLGTLKEAGIQHGYGQYANAIQKSPSGRYSVSDPGMRATILNLRQDPTANSAMAGVLTRSNSLKLKSSLGRNPTDAELYMAHFLGAGGASRLISGAEQTPSASAVAMFPRAAAANASIFYDRSGKARSVSQVYSVLEGRYAKGANAPVTRTMLASLQGVQPTTAAVAASSPATPFDGVLQAQSVTVNLPSVDVANSQPTRYHSLFQAGERRDGVSNAVRDLWGRSDATANGSSSTPATSGSSQSLDLFSDRSGLFAF